MARRYLRQRVCRCGCGITFETPWYHAKYLNRAHFLRAAYAARRAQFAEGNLPKFSYAKIAASPAVIQSVISLRSMPKRKREALVRALESRGLRPAPKYGLPGDYGLSPGKGRRARRPYLPSYKDWRQEGKLYGLLAGE